MTVHGDTMEIDLLTTREVQILALIAKGRTNREIADQLVLSVETIKWYNKRAYQKLGVRNRVQAVKKAAKWGLLDKGRTTKETAPARPRHNLPAELSSFVGRAAELAEVRQLLDRSRLVTLTGPGGTGKTRLALRLAHTMVKEEDRRVAYVSLAPVSDPALVVDAIVDALGVTSTGEGGAQAAILRYLYNKDFLLLLDNCEHLLPVAPLVSALLAGASGLKVLATSREALHLNGEQVYVVPPLTVPVVALGKPVAELSGFEAVMLFTQRAAAVSGDFCLTEENAATIAAICAQVDGLPLAIELAAARIRLLTPQQLQRQLQQRFDVLGNGARDLPPRQRTLWDTIEWSYHLLDKDERRLFARLAVFSDGFSLEAAAAVCGHNLAAGVIALVDSLLAKSLLYRTDGHDQTNRLRMLATVHEFARERLVASGESDQMEARRLAYFLELAETIEPRFRYQGQLPLLHQVDADFSNFRAAFSWALANERIEAAARLLAAIDYYLIYSQHTGEGYRWLEQVAGRREEIGEQWRARVLLAAARVACNKGDRLQLGRQFCREGLAVARRLGDRRQEAWLLLELAILSGSDEEDYETAIALNEQGLALAKQLEDGAAIAAGCNVLGELWRMAGDDRQARRAYEQSLAACRETGERFREAMVLSNLSFVAYNGGDFVEARQLAEKHLREMLAMRIKKPCDIMALSVLAGALNGLGELEMAARLLGASESLMDEMGAAYQRQDRHQIDRYVADVRARLDEATFHVAWREGQAMSLEQAVAYAIGDADLATAA
jgi:predicted ATPase/DNA-binding CsgD family transcriptional regulator